MKIQAIIEKKLTDALSPSHLSVVNESYMHNVPEGSESHFNVTLVSDEFSLMRQVARHQKIYGILTDEMSGGVHALALHTYSPEEWITKGNTVPKSPDCKGG